MATTPDPRQLSTDPRLSSPATYVRDVVISSITSLYQSLPHIDPSDIQFPPPVGWPEITSASLAAKGLQKTDEAVELLRHLPYITGKCPWVAPDSFVLDYRRFLEGEDGKYLFVWELAGYDDSDSVPPWVVQLTTGKSHWPMTLCCLVADAEKGNDASLKAYMLDTSDGTVTKYAQQVVYPDPARFYSEKDPRCWRNHCDDQTWPVEQFVHECQAKYRNLEWLGMPGNMKWPGVLEYSDDVEPGGFLYKENIKLREIYREHGWPDSYKGGECRVAIQHYWDNK